MARLGASKNKKSPRATELSQLKKELKRVTEQLESCKRELAEGQNGKQPREKSCVLSPARQRNYNRC